MKKRIEAVGHRPEVLNAAVIPKTIGNCRAYAGHRTGA